ncbi:hypothetical protein QYF61_017160 [Mycteria americana]|uniref:Uncharacterized protein n=1 Tax=Mycteria americana TaxID=33587 RepID=A0AAN7RVX2_MYCAM|nr:hypothetical protein QYF61_017160 [Mycteria americana]
MAGVPATVLLRKRHPQQSYTANPFGSPPMGGGLNAGLGNDTRGEVFQPSDPFCGPPLDPLQQLHVFPVLRTPELDTVHQYPQVLLLRAALNPFIPQPVLILGVAPAQVQDLQLGLDEPHKVHMGPLLKLVQVPLNGIPSLRHVNHTTQLGVLCKFAEGALDPTVYVVDEDIKQCWSQYRPLRDTTHH